MVIPIALKKRSQCCVGKMVWLKAEVEVFLEVNDISPLLTVLSNTP